MLTLNTPLPASQYKRPPVMHHRRRQSLCGQHVHGGSRCDPALFCQQTLPAKRQHLHRGLRLFPILIHQRKAVVTEEVSPGPMSCSKRLPFFERSLRPPPSPTISLLQRDHAPEQTGESTYRRLFRALAPQYPAVCRANGARIRENLPGVTPDSIPSASIHQPLPAPRNRTIKRNIRRLPPPRAASPPTNPLLTSHSAFDALRLSPERPWPSRVAGSPFRSHHAKTKIQIRHDPFLRLKKLKIITDNCSLGFLPLGARRDPLALVASAPYGISRYGGSRCSMPPESLVVILPALRPPPPEKLPIRVLAAVPHRNRSRKNQRICRGFRESQ